MGDRVMFHQLERKLAGLLSTAIEEEHLSHEVIERTDRFVEWWFDYRFSPRPPQAVSARLIITPTQGEPMPGAITVDTTDESATLQFTDDHGDTDAAPPVGAVVAFASDNTAVATVAADAANPLKGNITPVAEGTANISVTVAAADGSPLLEADGVTPFPTPSPVQVTVSAGAAVGASLTLSV